MEQHIQARLRAAHGAALAALREGRAATAEHLLRALEAQFPGEVNCLWLIGAALLDQNKISESVVMLERVMAAAPDFANARVDLARAYRCAGRAAQAREEVRRVLEKTPHHHRAWLAYGDALVDLGQHADAAIAFERARLTDPERPRVEEATSALVTDDRKDHWDAVLPGKVLHMQYEELVGDPEANIRRLLEHCGLGFEPACLDFHMTQRSVRTASAEQVRQPLYTSGVGYWRHFAEELATLRSSLGECLARFADPG